MAAFQDNLKKIYERIARTFANSRKRQNKQVTSEDYDVSDGPRVSSNGHREGETVSQESITQSLLEELRNTSETGEQIELIADRDPDVSMAVWSFQRLAFQGFNIEITDLNGNRLKDAELQFENECKSWNELSIDGLDGIVDTLNKAGLLYNIMMIEVVVSRNNPNNTFEGVYIIDPRDIEWELETRDGKQQWIPYQNQEDGRVDLSTGNVFWAVVNQDIDSPVGAYLLEPAIASVDYKLQTMSDSSAVLRHNGYPFNIWKINKERLINTLPPSEQNNREKVSNAIRKAMSDAKSAAYDREPTQDIIITDDIDVDKNSNANAGSSIDVRAWTEQVDVQVMNGVKSLGILLNRSQGDTETWGSVQMKVITEMVRSFQRKSKRLIEQVGAIWLQLNGIQGYFKMNHKPLDYQSENQKWESQNKKMDFYVKAHNQRYVTADDAAKNTMDNEGAVIDIFEEGNVIGVTASGKEIEKSGNTSE